LNRFHERRALKNADALLSVSQYTADMTKMLFKLTRNFTVIPNGVDLLRFSVRQSEAPAKTILYFGTLIRKKGLLELPHIFNLVHEKHPGSRLVLAGKDSADVLTGSRSTWSLMQPLFDRSSVACVDYLGKVPYEAMQDQIAGAAVCVFPTFAEALPVSWIEAMAVGKAIVASDIGWADEVIEDGVSGYLIDPKNHEGFAAKIADLLVDETLAAQMGAAARERVEAVFDIEKIARRNLEFYRRLTK
jgi:glycosyltransferase involved in cell wall biosynthesis